MLTSLLAALPLVVFGVSSDPEGGRYSSCQAICDTVPSCRDGWQGSYCKPGDIVVCFGLFENSDGSNCYFPAGGNCDQSRPVACPAVALSHTSAEPSTPTGSSAPSSESMIESVIESTTVTTSPTAVSATTAEPHTTSVTPHDTVEDQTTSN